MNGMTGGDPGVGFLSGALGSMAGFGTTKALAGASSATARFFGTVGSGALMGGVSAKLAGGSFWDGF